MKFGRKDIRNTRDAQRDARRGRDKWTYVHWLRSKAAPRSKEIGVDPEVKLSATELKSAFWRNARLRVLRASRLMVLFSRKAGPEVVLNEEGAQLVGPITAQRFDAEYLQPVLELHDRTFGTRKAARNALGAHRADPA